MQKKLTFAILVVVGIIFLPTTVFLLFGMMPTIAAFVSDRSVGRNKTICVGLMNLAGCFPFLLDFWTGSELGQNTVGNAFRLASDLETIIVIYMIAAGGYAIDKAVTGITASIIIQKAEKRVKKIDKEQERLTVRWGEKVTGLYKLDDYGFPLTPIPSKNAVKQETAKQPSEQPEQSD